MQRLFFAVAGFALAMALASPAQAGTRLKLVNPAVASGVVSHLHVRVLDDAGKPAKSIIVKSVRVDMGPDNMKDMTTPAKVSTMPGMVMVETNIYAPGRWAVILTGTADGKPFSGSVVVTATMKKAEAALPPPAPSQVSNQPRKILYYRNPMGLADTSTVPKKDSMGMDYIPVYADEIARKPGTIQLTAAKIQHAGVRLANVTLQPLSRAVRAPGIVAADENRQGVLTARFSGFIDTLLVSQTGDVVRRGQPLMRVWIENNDVLVRIADYLGAYAAKDKDRAAQAAAILHQYGIADGALQRMAKTGQTRIVTLNAPMGGTVMEKPAVAGMRFAAGDTLFKITDLRGLWVMADIGERDLPLVKAGMTAHVRFRDDPGRDISGKVLLVYPALDGTTRTAKARIALANAGSTLRIGQYADVRIDAPVASTPVLTIPASAVIDDGTRTVAFVSQPGGVFEPRPLKLGFRSGDMVEVRSGVRGGEKVVVTGNFLIDAESNLQAALHAYAPKEAKR